MILNHKPLIISLAIAVVMLSGFSVFRATAQDHNNDDISERLLKQGVPLISVSTINWVPYEIKIALQSRSVDGHLTIDDNWNMILASREAALAYRWGARLRTYQVVVCNSAGEVISSTQTYLYPQDLSQRTAQRKSVLDNQATAELIKSKLRTGGLTLNRLEVFDGGMVGTSGQVLSIETSTENLTTANQSLPDFIDSYFWVLENLNQEYGTNIVMTHLRIRNSQSENLLDYVGDVEGGHAQWTLAKGVYSDWFPHPPSDLYATPTPGSGTESLEVYPPPATATPVSYP